MKRLVLGVGLGVLLLAGFIKIPADAQSRILAKDQLPSDPSTLVYGPVHKLFKSGVDHSSGPQRFARGSRVKLTYYGGPVLANVKMVKVEYGSGTYQSFITGTGAGTMAAFLSGITGSAYISWLKEYNTSSPVQTIGLGSYGGDFPITPSSGNNGSTITDTQIQAEISAQISSGSLPAPDANTVYSVFFPKGKTISQGGSNSCVAGGFCAYHGTFSRNGQDVYYAVLPDATGGCATGCGANSHPFNNQTSVLSHEMTESITDPAVGLATVYGPPLAWYNATYGEIGDLCNAQQTTVTGTDGVVYVVQKEWDNSTGTCKATFQ